MTVGRTFLKRAYRELVEMSRIVTDRSLTWTIARFAQPKERASPGIGN